ncbi:MAG: helix-turn-helix transcriptional regulator [Clostridia bacterium]|nr:helix-turn-helix transcriptional regulator [Clostridia bacterium]
MKKRKSFFELLKKKGITAYKLSKILGYKDSGSVYKWVYGKSEPNAATMLKLCLILGISAEEVLRIFAEEASE